MSMYSLLRSKAEKPTEEEIEEALGGNLCRCTGYRPILAGFNTFARDAPDAAYSNETIDGHANGNGHAANSNGHVANGNGHATNGDGHATNGNGHATNGNGHATNGNGHATNGNGHATNGNGHATNGNDAVGKPTGKGSGPVCPSTGQPCTSGCGDTPAAKAIGAAEYDPMTSVKEPIFPPELKRRVPAALNLPGDVATWYRPNTLPGLLALKKMHPAARLVCGNTEVGDRAQGSGRRGSGGGLLLGNGVVFFGFSSRAHEMTF
jgi:xanthine dehydrogenase/oxidase